MVSRSHAPRLIVTIVSWFVANPIRVVVLPDFNAVDIVILRFSRLLTKTSGAAIWNKSPQPVKSEPPFTTTLPSQQHSKTRWPNQTHRRKKTLRTGRVDAARLVALLKASSAFAIHLVRDGQVGMGVDPTRDVWVNTKAFWERVVLKIDAVV